MTFVFMWRILVQFHSVSSWLNNSVTVKYCIFRGSHTRRRGFKIRNPVFFSLGGREGGLVLLKWIFKSKDSENSVPSSYITKIEKSWFWLKKMKARNCQC